MKHAKSFFCFLLCCYSFAIQSQTVISSSGGNSNGVSGSVSYTVGQIFYSTVSGSNGNVAEGVQQPYEISVVTGLGNNPDINLKWLVYPNPTTGLTKLVFESPDFENMRFRLFDITGVLLQDRKVESRETEISLENLSSSVYFLKVLDNNIEVKVFRIVKK